MIASSVFPFQVNKEASEKKKKASVSESFHLIDSETQSAPTRGDKREIM